MKKCKGDFRGCGVQVCVCVCVHVSVVEERHSASSFDLHYLGDQTTLRFKMSHYDLNFPFACFPCDHCYLSFLIFLVALIGNCWCVQLRFPHACGHTFQGYPWPDFLLSTCLSCRVCVCERERRSPSGQSGLIEADSSWWVCVT